MKTIWSYVILPVTLPVAILILMVILIIERMTYRTNSPRGMFFRSFRDEPGARGFWERYWEDDKIGTCL